MQYDAKKLNTAIKSIDCVSVMYFYSDEEYMTENAVSKALAALSDDEKQELTKTNGDELNLQQLADELAAVSFSGARRVVYINNLQPAILSDADIDELCGIIENIDGALLIIDTCFADDKAMLSKKAKKLQNISEQKGIAAQLCKPGAGELQAFVKQLASDEGAALGTDAAAALIDRCGSDQLLLSGEIKKLAAACGYGEITAALVNEMAVKSIEADVFDMVRCVTDGKAAQAFKKLSQLIYLQNEPIAVAAALSGSYVDMYRVKCGVETGHTYQQVFKEMGYKGSDYRLKKAQQNAAAYTMKNLKKAVELLAGLDLSLKSNPTDGAVLLQTAVAELLLLKRR